MRRLLFGTKPLEESEAMETPDPGTLADEDIAAQQRREKLDRAIATLPPQLKEPLLLTAFDGLSQQEAGEILGVSAKTVETRVYRARKLLAERLDTDLRPSAS